MKTLIATLLATAAGAGLAAPTVALTHDPATYRNVTQKLEADYKTAVAKCDAMSGNDKNVCMAEAKVGRTRAEADILSRYNTTPVSRERARTSMADAEYNLAKAKCDGKAGADKDDCMNNARSVHTAALSDAKADRASGGSGATAATSATPGATTTTTTTTAGTAVLVRNADAGTDPASTSTAASKTRDAAATAADKTKAVAATVAEKTKEAAETAVEKTKQAASTLAQKTENTFDRSGENGRQAASSTAQKTDDAGEHAADRTAAAGGKARVAAADTAITAKVKAGLIKEAKLDALGIHVETEKGTVMLSGFVNSQADADKALQVAKGVKGVGNVKSALQVK